MKALSIVFMCSALFVPLIFGTDHVLMVLGVVLWGIGQGAIESILRGAVCDLVPAERRGAGYGIFSTGYGVFWFIGNFFTGLLYVINIPLMIVVSVTLQLMSVALFFCIQRRMGRRSGPKAAGPIRPGETPS